MTKQDKTPKQGKTTTDVEEATEAGYLGTPADPEPNESYTVEGVTAQPDVDDPEYSGGPGVDKPDPEATGPAASPAAPPPKGEKGKK